jgi:protein ImuA
LEEAFSDRCLPAGSLVELLPLAEGAGAWTLALLMGKQACGESKALIIADGQRCFYPPAACKLGIDLRRTLVIRPRQREKALAALVQSLRCVGVGAVIGKFEQVSSAEVRRLQLAAETGGGVGFLLLPESARRAPSFATVRLVIQTLVSRPEHDPANAKRKQLPRRIQVEVARLRGGKSGQFFLLEVDDETGHVRVPAPMATAATVARSTCAAGKARGHHAAGTDRGDGEPVL